MNIIVPIGGLGKRFKDEGYTQPKPLIKALGRPIIFWVLDNLDVTPEDYIFIIYRSEFIQYGFAELIKVEYPDKNIVTIPLFRNTSGAAETVKEVLESDEIQQHLNKPILIVDSDSYSEDRITVHLRNNPSNPSNIIYCYTDTNPEPKFSYVKTIGNRVTEIKEKVKISDRICIGSYGFSSGKFLLDIITSMQEQKMTLKYAKEFYLSSIYAYMIEKNIAPINFVDVKTFRCLGTPMQLQNFCNVNKSVKKYRFCFDLDDTLVTKPEVPGNYNTVKPIEQNVQLLRKLYEHGHTIIIYTARHMRTCKGNAGMVVARIGQTVLGNLDEFNIPHHELYFGKPYAHFYIDDLAVNANNNLEKSLGFYNLYPPIRAHHQNIIFTETTVTKQSEHITGEIWWYQHIPKTLQCYFPKYHQSSKNSLTVERINGIPLSYMLINQSLTEQHVKEMIEILRIIHSTKPDSNQPKVDISQIYSGKFDTRIKLHDFSKYENSGCVIKKVRDFLLHYEQKATGNCIVHGDPVLTNILYDLDRKYKFIDMRGCTGVTLSILGDPNYDFAKLYQSLCGYEYILLDRKPNEQYLKSLRAVFEDQIDVADIRMITASLLLTLIPLHPADKGEKYYNLAKSIV